MNKILCIISNLFLLIWFFLNMIGISIDGKILVTRSYKYDGLFFIIFLAFFLLFIFYEKVGKYLLMGWLFMWLLTQFFSHWYYTIFGPSEGKINYFADTIKLIPSSNTYIPDLYHIILHVLILVSLMCVLSNLIFSKKAL